MKNVNRRLHTRTLCLLLVLSMLLVLIPFGAFADNTANCLTNGDFETTEGATWAGEPVGWSVNIVNSDSTAWGQYTVKSGGTNNTTSYLELSNYNKNCDMTASATQTVSLEAGTYTASIQSAGANQGSSSSNLVLSAVSGGKTLGSSAITLGGWDTWTTSTINFTLDSAADVTIGVTGTLADSSYCDLDNATLIASDDEGGNSDGYVVTVTPSATDVKAGDTVTLTAKVTNNGTEVTDLEAAGLYLWWWTDVWATDHTDGLSDTTYSNYDDNSGHSLTADVTLPSEGTYYIAAELQDSSYSRLEISYTTLNTTAPTAELVDILLDNGNFENGTTNWTLSGFSSVAADSWNTSNTTNTLNLWLSDSEAVAGSATYTVTLTAGTYQFGFDLSGAESDSGLSYSVTAGDTVLVSGSETYTTTGYGNWTTYTTDAFTLAEDATVTFTLSGTVPADYWGNLDNLTLKGTGAIVEDVTPPVTAPIDVEKVSSLSDDFIMGLDISSVISEFNSGVTYQDFEGNEINNVTDFCKFLAECGVTHVRVRVWNDPYDATGNGYGGGNNDVATAVKIAQACAAANLKLLVDFHCSDFWTDPSKQMVPKAWTGYTVDQKADALKTFLTGSLTAIKATGAEIAMVQVGNETTGGFIGETSTANMCTLFNAGSAAIRAFDSSIKVVIHVTNPEKSTMTTWAANLAANNVDYDILATSYYPSWHGTLANLKSQLQIVKNTYGKDVMVAETSYAFTLAETDGHENTIREGNNDTMLCETQYPFTVQGQANYLRDLIATVNEAGGLGVYYWEPAWITVGDSTGLEGDAYTTQVDANKALWEQFGSGWAASYSAQYDPDDAGKWYGGSAVDNQALFAADGSPLASINVWKYVRSGAVSKYVTVEAIANAIETIEAGGTYTLPETVTVTYNKGVREESVQWNTDDVSAITIDTVGTYVVHGTVTLAPNFAGAEYQGDPTDSVTYTLTVKAPNLIGDDWSFENGSANFSGLASTGKGIDGETPYDGSYCLHWYLTEAGTAAVTYNGANSAGIPLEPGKYTFECVAQGYAGDTVTLSVLSRGSDTVIAAGDETALTGWAVWAAPTVSFTVTETTTVDLQMTIGIQAGGWGTVDCLYLYKTGDITVPPTTTDPTVPPAVTDPTVPSAPSGQDDVSIDTSEVNLLVQRDSKAPAIEITTSKAAIIEMLIEGNGFTEDELDALANGASIDLILKISDASATVSSESKAQFEKATAGYTIGCYLDISLFKQINRAEPIPLSETKEAITLSLQVPADLLNTDNSITRTFYIVQNHNGSISFLPTTYDAETNTLTFETNQFSDYAIAYKDTANTTDTTNTATGTIPKTGDTFNPVLCIALLIVSLCGIAVIIILSRKKYSGKYLHQSQKKH